MSGSRLSESKGSRGGSTGVAAPDSSFMSASACKELNFADGTEFIIQPRDPAVVVERRQAKSRSFALFMAVVTIQHNSTIACATIP